MKFYDLKYFLSTWWGKDTSTCYNYDHWKMMGIHKTEDIVRLNHYNRTRN